MLPRSLLYFSLLVGQDQAPLETLNVTSTSLSAQVVQQLAQLIPGTAIDKTAIESACARLQATGLFTDIHYSYAPGPKRGYLVTLNLTDQPATVTAVIDLPTVPEDEAWL